MFIVTQFAVMHVRTSLVPTQIYNKIYAIPIFCYSKYDFILSYIIFLLNFDG